MSEPGVAAPAAAAARPIYNPCMCPSDPHPVAAPPDLFAARREHQRRRAMALAPAERLAVMDGLIADAWRLLESNPAALRHFVQRNYHRRRAGCDGEKTDDGI